MADSVRGSGAAILHAYARNQYEDHGKLSDKSTAAAALASDRGSKGIKA